MTTSAQGPFWTNVHFGPTCWEWIGAPGSGGYGQRRFEGKPTGAHRVSWIMENGPIPNGLWVLHKCDNPPCVRPDHLFLGTHVDNMVDMTAKGRHAELRVTHCPAGHEYDDANTYIRPQGKRRCQACHRIEQRARKRAALAGEDPRWAVRTALFTDRQLEDLRALSAATGVPASVYIRQGIDLILKREGLK